MYLKKYRSALFLAILITLIYVMCWMAVAVLFDTTDLFSMDPQNGSENGFIPAVFYLSLSTLLVFFLMRAQMRKRSDLECQLQFATETLEARVKTRMAEFEKYVGETKELKGIIPICAQCKNIRNSDGQWEKIEIYIQNRSQAEFSHGLCPKCDKALYGDKRLHFEAIAQKYT